MRAVEGARSGGCAEQRSVQVGGGRGLPAAAQANHNQPSPPPEATGHLIQPLLESGRSLALPLQLGLQLLQLLCCISLLLIRLFSLLLLSLPLLFRDISPGWWRQLGGTVASANYCLDQRRPGVGGTLLSQRRRIFEDCCKI